MRIVFMGSPAFSVPCLEAVAALGHDVVAVVTQPDKPAGRGMSLVEPAVKVAAKKLGFPVWQPASVRKPPFLDELKAVSPDLAVVVAYGKILPAEVLAAPRLGCVNVHASLLPKYRGAAPIQWAIMEGERETGVTLMQMDAGMDTGAMLLVRAIPIDEEVTAGVMHERLSQLGAEILREGLPAIERGALTAEKQDDSRATMAPMLTKETGRVDFAKGARSVRDRARGCNPWPGSFTTVPVRGKSEVLKLFSPKLVSGRGEPGVVLGADRDGLLVGCGADAIAFGAMQLPGGKRLAAEAFLAGHPVPTGTRLGE